MFEVIQHTADVRLRIRAESVEELFSEPSAVLPPLFNPSSCSPPSSIAR